MLIYMYTCIMIGRLKPLDLEISKCMVNIFFINYDINNYYIVNNNGLLTVSRIFYPG